MLFRRAYAQYENVLTCSKRLQSKLALNVLKVHDFGVDFNAYSDLNTVARAEKNISNRKGVGDIRQVLQLKMHLDKEVDKKKRDIIEDLLLAELKKLPNVCHPDVENYQEPKVIRHAKCDSPKFQLKQFSALAKNLKMIRMETLKALTGTRSYYLLDGLADLEHALVRYIVQSLLKQNFTLISVPDIVPEQVIERCGMTVRSHPSQVYMLDESRWSEGVCLSGTAEMALGGMLVGSRFAAQELPLRLAAVSRCYRSEISNVQEEKGIFRVHTFTKVEMFGVCREEKSEELLTELKAIQEKHFRELGLDFQTLDMPPCELGASAQRKHDIEAWFPAKKHFGEISSCSNCTDYQARRLDIRVDGKYAHTVNGTACAVPRTIMALLETHQQPDGSILLPGVLAPYMPPRLAKRR